jgi:serine/threonine protein kinase/tetratricopeptide (TPR) repeat protein
MIGATLGHYRLVEQIGAGGAGVVYLARDERLEREVAIKVLSQRTGVTETGRRKFRREALALSRTNHPNIATVHDFHNEDGLDYLVMEYIPGHSLSQLVMKGALSNEETIALGCQLADGLALAHVTGVVHGDLKPGNIRVTPDGRLKILDFGLAHIISPDDATTETMTERSLGGTLPYMAPEQIRGQPSDKRSDVYSAGVVLYEMATGNRAFNAINDAALMNAILQGKPDPPTATDPQVSAGLNAIVMKAMDLDPALRYQSARELQVDLHRLSTRHSPPVVVRRRKWKTVAAAGVVVGVAVASLLSWRYDLVSRRDSSSTPPPASTGSTAQRPPSGSALRVEVTPAEVIGAPGDVADWPGLIRGLLATELAGVPEISLLDPGAGEARPGAGSADLTVRLRILLVGSAREIHCSVIESATSEVSFSTRTSVDSEAKLAPAVREISGALSAFFRLRSNGPEFARDLRPWISSRIYKAEAVAAFVHGAMYVFRFQPGVPRRYFQIALDIDPTFVAPRIWRMPTLLQEGKAQADLEYLRSIEPQASPFEQTMIAYVIALADGNHGAQARHLEVALKYAPGNRILLINLARVQESQRDCRAAVETLAPLIQSRWAYGPLYTQWAGCAVDVGLIDDARRTLEASLTVVPPFPDVYAFLGALAILRNDSKEAARHEGLITERLKELGNPPAYSQLIALAYSRVGQHALRTGAFAQAVPIFEKAVQHDPLEPAYHDKLADTFEELGRTRESRIERNRALTLGRQSREPSGR